MPSLNSVSLIGNVGRDAEMKYLSTGTAMADFSLAINDRKDNVEWMNIVLFGETAEKISQYITKGKMVYVGGRIQTRSWEDSEGQKHFRTEVVANNVQFLDRRPRDE